MGIENMFSSESDVTAKSSQVDWRQVAQGIHAGSDLVIGLDADGTILRHDTSLSERVRDAIQAHIAAGTHIVVTTGRGIQGTQIVLEKLGMECGFAVAANGAIILAIGENSPVPTEEIAAHARNNLVDVRLVRAHTFDPSKEIAIIHEALPQALMALESLTTTPRITGPFPPGELNGETTIVPVEELVVPLTTRVTVRAPSMSAEEMLDAVKDLGLPGVHYNIGWSAWMDLAPQGINKAVGLQDVVDIVGAHHTIAVGDSDNDCDMLRWAEVGVAMGNAIAHVRAAANTVCPPVDEDGLAQFLETLL
ncbi:HAD family hydrolase [Trueperella sp. LYQ143]|uniref:HAD family hydrolase n=1 Tax=Trueperella sp. LYQ143 TaxID=3391059 RepID=UPI0039833361